jgi:N-acyl-D-aspartate/D-glutamate deacylase
VAGTDNIQKVLMAGIARTRRLRAVQVQQWFIELALAAALATIAAVLLSPQIFEEANRGPAIAPSVLSDELPEPEFDPAEIPVLGGGAAPAASVDQVYDIAINGGRVMDPQSGFDKVVNVGVSDGQIVGMSDKPLQGTKTIDAAGRVVSPGFIDLESYDPNPYGIWFKIADGVTTNLGMHGTNAFAEEWYPMWESTGSPAHFGGAFDDNWYRQRLDGLALGVADEATPEQIDEIAEAAEEDLQNGYIAVEFSPEYAPGITYEEIVAVCEIAAEYDVPAFFHVRYSDPDSPGTNFEAVQEVIDVARETGVRAHILHINSTGGTFTMDQSLQMIADAREEGLEITADTYPYTFWATTLASERFAPGWEERFRIDYDDLVIPGTGERLTEETFAIHQNNNELAAAFAIPGPDVKAALQSDFVMVGSDAILEPGDNNHPRGAGTFARLLGKYVRQDAVIPLMDALRKITIQPADLIDDQIPSLQTKGRLQVGADADITIFDPASVRDAATVLDPSQRSKGIDWVIVAGTVVKGPNGLRKGQNPGDPIKSEFGTT